MLSIEKIKTTHTFKPHPGLVDLLVGCDSEQTWLGNYVRYTPKIFGHTVRSLLAKQGILLGANHGSQGIHFGEIRPNKDVIYEISALDYMRMTRKARESLHDVQLVVTDLLEGGTTFSLNEMSNPHVKIGGGFSTSEIPLSFPVFWACTAASYQTRGWPEIHQIDSQGDILFLAGKARRSRLDLLEKLEHAELLEKTKWSLFYNLEEKFENAKFYYQQGFSQINLPRHSDHEFIKRHSHHLPKYYEVSIDTDMSYVPEFTDAFSWYISSETMIDAMFPTEKTFKAFAVGINPVINACPGFNTELEKLGFDLQGDYDHLAGDDRIDALVNMLKFQESDSERVKHNQAVLQDTVRVSNMIVDVLRQLPDQFS